MDAPNKQHFLPCPPGWCLFPAGARQSFSSGLCAPGGKLCSTSHTGKTKPSAIKVELLSGAARAQGAGACRKGRGSRRRFALPAVPVIPCPTVPATARAPAVSPGEGAALPPLPGGQSPTWFVPRGGWDRPVLEPFALSRPGEHENIPAVPSWWESLAWDMGPHKGWAQLGELCHPCPQMVA